MYTRSTKRTFVRETQQPDTFGMCTRSARRVTARATGQLAAEEGRHRGGPCPAVALATLTGWTYARAERVLQDFGFKGAGMFRGIVLLAFEKVLGRPAVSYDCRGLNVATAVMDKARGRDGIAFCRGHVMPIRDGRLLNAAGEHRGAPCEGIVLWDIVEEVTL